jgi:DNA-binding transcriptional ArsR family regulator
MAVPTSDEADGTEAYSLDATFSCLAHDERRRIVQYLSEVAPEPVSLDDLRTALAARTRGKPREDVTADERRAAALALHHEHLPSLAAAGFVDHDADDGTVTLAEHPALRDPGVLEAIDGDAPADSGSLDALFRALANERSRTILDALSHQFGPIHTKTLARELGANDRATTDSEVPEEEVEKCLVLLGHVDLPRLSEAGLVEYDADERTVAYAGHPQLRVPWMHSVFEPEFRTSLTGESEPGGIGEIKGRDRVISFGQSLCDRADEELFCMFTDTQLLEAGCLTRIRDASRRRGVDVYLGTRDPTIREYVEENAPDVVLWEPNTDWLNLPAAGDRVGRLLLADREAVMLGTLLEETTDGLHEEQSIVGEGEHNTLVTMICQLLAPRLDEVDKGSEDVEVRLPL